MSRSLLQYPRLTAWFRSNAQPEPGAIVLRQRRVYILPTRLGLIFAATLLVLLLGSINYVLSLGFVLTFVLSGMAVAGMVHTVRNLMSLSIQAGRVEPVFAGEAAQFRLFLENGDPFDRVAILVRHDVSGAQTVLDVPAGTSSAAVLPVPAERRGWLPIGRVMLETRFPLGLFRAWSNLRPDLRALVYPRPEASTLPQPSPEASSGSARLTAQGTDDFSGLRAYQFSDSPRHVAWKAVARSEDMLTKQFSGQSSAELWLDWALLPPDADNERRLSRLAGWVLAAERAGVRYGLRIPGRTLAPDRGDVHLAACLTTLALYDAAAERSPAEAATA
ncbi:MAG: DUF58 domain-containing protein [Betaproteobacteria bacterium]|nr:DUF58 domain-containing protein [Betaproteobacteria bacterium]